jgi:hypothetical protein
MIPRIIFWSIGSSSSAARAGTKAEIATVPRTAALKRQPFRTLLERIVFIRNRL